MELRVLHTAAHQQTWYGQWGYKFGRAGFNLSATSYHRSLSMVHRAEVWPLLHRLCLSDSPAALVVARYQVQSRLSKLNATLPCRMYFGAVRAARRSLSIIRTKISGSFRLFCISDTFETALQLSWSPVTRQIPGWLQQSPWSMTCRCFLVVSCCRIARFVLGKKRGCTVEHAPVGAVCCCMTAPQLSWSPGARGSAGYPGWTP